MVSRAVKTRICDRCPANKSVKATHLEVPLRLGEQGFKLDLCDTHYLELDRVVYAWGRLGEEMETVVRFGAEYRETGQRIAALRSAQATPVATAPVTRKKALHLSGSIPQGLPADANEWVFSEHAKERMDERNISAVAALRAACTPTFSHVHKSGDSRYPSDAMVHETDGVRAIVKVESKEILTVARRDTYEERKAL